MKEISLREVCHLLKKKKLVKIGDFQARIRNEVEYVNEPDHIFLDLNWEDDGIKFEASFATKDNKTIRVEEGSKLKLISTYGDVEEVVVL